MRVRSRQPDRHLPRLQEAYERPCADRCSCDAPYSIRRHGIATELPLHALQVAERPSLFGLGSPPGTGEQENGVETRPPGARGATGDATVLLTRAGRNSHSHTQRLWPKTDTRRALDPGIHHWRSTRQRGYGCSLAGERAVTIITHHRAHSLGPIHYDVVKPTEAGRIAHACWSDLQNHYAHVELDAFVTVPNHAHGIVVRTDEPEERAGLGPAHTDVASAQPVPVGAGLRPALGKLLAAADELGGAALFSS